MAIYPNFNYEFHCVFNSRDGKFNISFFLNGIIRVIRIHIFSFAKIRYVFYLFIYLFLFATILIIPIVFRAKVNGEKNEKIFMIFRLILNL